jgi:hypothetical protein
MTKLAEIVVEFTTVTLFGVIPVMPGKLMVATLPTMKFVPVSVTATVLPCAPPPGRMLVSVGGPTTVNGTVPLVPAEFETLTFCAPGTAFAAMVKVAVIVVGLTTAVLETVMPVGTLIVEPGKKLLPVSVTVNVPPWAPLDGVMDARVGGP